MSRGHPFEKLLREGVHIVSLKQACKKHYGTVVSYAQWINLKLWVPTIKAKKRVQWVHTDLMAAGCPGLFADSRLRRKIDSFICVSNKATESFRRLYPHDIKKVHTLYNMVDDAEIRRKADLPQDEIVPTI